MKLRAPQKKLGELLIDAGLISDEQLGQALSLQMHHRRAEHWVVVAGTARVTRGDEVFLLHENESAYVSHGTRHRIENPTEDPLQIVEVQTGGYLGEDDIVRYHDDYARS